MLLGFLVVVVFSCFRFDDDVTKGDLVFCNDLDANRIHLALVE